MKMQLRRQDRKRFELEIIRPKPIFSNLAEPRRLFRKILECLTKNIGSIHLPVGPLKKAYPDILSSEILRPPL
jgi:hypothetical protein